VTGQYQNRRWRSSMPRTRRSPAWCSRPASVDTGDPVCSLNTASQGRLVRQIGAEFRWWPRKQSDAEAIPDGWAPRWTRTPTLKIEAR
jgi:hypothetical protein